jgi:hypothetical protein
MLFAIGYFLPSNSVFSFLAVIILVEALRIERIYLASFIAGQLTNRTTQWVYPMIAAVTLMEWVAPPLLTVGLSLLLGIAAYINKWWE